MNGGRLTEACMWGVVQRRVFMWGMHREEFSCGVLRREELLIGLLSRVEICMCGVSWFSEKKEGG